MSNNNVELTKQNLSIEVNPDNNDVTVQPTQATTEITKNHLIFEIKKEDNEVTVNASPKPTPSFNWKLWCSRASGGCW